MSGYWGKDAYKQKMLKYVFKSVHTSQNILEGAVLNDRGQSILA